MSRLIWIYGVCKSLLVSPVAVLELNPIKMNIFTSVYRITVFTYAFGQTGSSKQCRLRRDATERGVSSGSTLFAIHPAILDAIG